MPRRGYAPAGVGSGAASRSAGVKGGIAGDGVVSPNRLEMVAGAGPQMRCEFSAAASRRGFDSRARLVCVLGGAGATAMVEVGSR